MCHDHYSNEILPTGLRSAIWWTSYATPTVIAYLKGVSLPVSIPVFITPYGKLRTLTY